MRTCYSILLACIAGLCFTAFVAPQGDANEELKKINRVYSNAARLSMNINYLLFENADAKNPIDRQEGEIKKDGARIYSKVGPVEMVNTGEYDIKLDHADKTITVLKSISKNPINADEQLLLNIEKALELCKKIEHADLKGSHASYTLIYRDEVPDFEKVVITYNTKNYFIDKIAFFYRSRKNLISDEEGKEDSPRLEIAYSNVNLNPKFSSQVFAPENYIKKVNGRLVPGDLYKNYKLINQQ